MGYVVEMITEGGYDRCYSKEETFCSLSEAEHFYLANIGKYQAIKLYKLDGETYVDYSNRLRDRIEANNIDYKSKSKRLEKALEATNYLWKFYFDELCAKNGLDSKKELSEVKKVLEL